MNAERRPRRTLQRAFGVVLAIAAAAAAAPGMQRDPPEVGGTAAPVNVLLVSFDTTRADVLGCYGNPRAASPRIDALAREGLRFAWAFSPVPLTLPSHATLFTGLNPPAHRVHHNADYALSQGALTLAEILSAEGYATSAEIGSVVLLPRFGLDQGFEVYGQGTMSLESGRPPQRRAEDVADAVIARLRPGRPFFAFVHFYDPHHPLEPPDEFAARFADDLYLGEIAYADHQLGRILDHLQEQSLLDQTLVIVTSDHGEGRGDHGEVSHGILLHDATQRVPLVLSHPRLPVGQTSNRLATLADILPTVLDFLGLPLPARSDGSSLLGPAPADAAAYLETLEPYLGFDWSPLHGLRTLEWKLVQGTRTRLFDMLADPGEEQDVAADHPELVALLRQRLGQRRNTDEHALARTTIALSDEELAVLGGLGYLAPLTDEPAAPDSTLPDPYDHIGAVGKILQSQAHLAEGQLEAAREILEPLAAELPGTFEVQHLLGACYGRLGRHADALERFERALEIHPQLLRARIDAGLAAHHAQKPALARRHLERAIAAEGCPPRASFLLFESHQQAGNSGKAKAVLRALLQRQDLDPAARKKAQELIQKLP